MTSTIALDPLVTSWIPGELQDIPAMLEVRNVRMIGRQGAPLIAPTPTDTLATAPATSDGAWTRDRFEKLASWISDSGRLPAENESYRGLYTLFDMTANAAGGWIIKAAAEQKAGVDYIQLRNELSSLTKLSLRITGQKAWPIEYRKVGRTYSYKMNPAIATWWFDITKKEDGS